MIRLILVRPKPPQPTPHLRCPCGEIAEVQLEVEYQNISNPVAYFCFEHAQQLSKDYEIQLVEVDFRPQVKGGK